MEKKARNFRNYKVWQDAVDYSTKVYQITDKNVLKWFDNKTLKIILNCNIDYWESGRFDFVPMDEPLKFRNFKIYQK